MATQVVSSRLKFDFTLPPAETMSIDRPADVEEGDLLFFAFVVMNDAGNDATNFLTTLVLPTGWSHAGYTATTTNRIIFVFKYVGDLDEEPTSYTFNYPSAAAPWTGIIWAVRGAARTFAAITFA